MYDSNDNFVIFMYCRIRRVQWALLRQKTYKSIRREYIRKHKHPKHRRICKICNKVIETYNEISIDHITPLSICIQYDMPMLEFDVRNFRLAHLTCNQTKASSIVDLPDNVKKILEKLMK